MSLIRIIFRIQTDFLETFQSIRMSKRTALCNNKVRVPFVGRSIDQVQTLIFSLFSARKLLQSENNKCCKVDEFNQDHIQNIHRVFLQISVHQNVKANGKQQLGVPVRTFIFSLFLPGNFFQSKINNCGNIDKFMQDVEKKKSKQLRRYFS